MTSIEDSSAGALRALRLHLEMGEIEAALAVYKKSSRRMADWQPAGTDWLDLIQALTEQEYWGEAAYVMRDYLEHAGALATRPPEAGPGADPETGAAHAGARHPARNPGGSLSAKLEPMRQEARSSRPSTCARKASSSCRMRCGKGEKRRTPSVGERCTHAERGYKEQKRMGVIPSLPRSAWRRRSSTLCVAGLDAGCPLAIFRSTAIGAESLLFAVTLRRIDRPFRSDDASMTTRLASTLAGSASNRSRSTMVRSAR